MQDTIGTTAGKIWQLLREKDEVNLANLPRLLGEKSMMVYFGLGWLAREDKVCFRSEGNKTYVAIAESEKQL